MMARLPKPGGDDNHWGGILNDYLSVSLDGAGNINNGAIGTNQIKSNAVTNAQLDSSTQSALSKANSSVQTVNGKSGSAVTLAATDVGALAGSGKATVSASSPSSPNTNDLWYDESTDLLKRYSGSTWVAAGSSTFVAQGSQVISAQDTAYGAIGNGSADDTAALTSWVNAINAASNGARAYLPAGHYMISSPLPSITNSGVTIYGSGWAQTNYTNGSVISANTGFNGTVMTLAGEGISLERLTLDGANRASTLVAVTGQNCQLQFMETRGVASNGVCIDVRTGGNSVWIHNCRMNGINNPNTGVQINDTDAIITGCKPVNNGWDIVLLSGASGAIIANNHSTPGGTGQNSIWINGNPSHILINGNRFDNYVRSAIQITPPASTPNDITISNNDFHSTIMTDNTYPLIAIDTTSSAVRNLKIMGNSGYASGSNRPAWGVAAQTQSGSVPTNTGRLSSLGTVVSGNSWWVATSLFGNANPSVALNNFISTDGTSWSSATDIYNFPSSSGSTSHAVYKQISSGITPSATSGTYGTAYTFSPDASFAGVLPTAISIATTGVNTGSSETLTLQSIATWSDSTTTTASINITTNSTTNLSASQLIAIMAGGDNKYATQFAWSAKSSITSSVASATVSILGANQS